jgi:hypothetical protein
VSDVSFTATDDFLAHYGIKGMRWGVRKADDSDSSPRKGLSDGQKKALKVGAGVAAVAGAAVVATILVKNGNVKVPSRTYYKPNPHGKEAADNFYNNVARGRKQVENMLRDDRTTLDRMLSGQQGSLYRMMEEEQKRLRLMGVTR